MASEEIVTIPSMYGIFTCIWWIFLVNVGNYTIHGCYGLEFRVQGILLRPRTFFPETQTIPPSNLLE